MRRLPGLALTVAIVLHGPPATAQDHRAAQVARAERLFDDAKKALDHNDIDKACRDFAESEKLDPQVGTLLNLALCHERQGKIASAWTEFTTVVSLASGAAQAKRASFAKAKARALEPRLARVRFDTSDLPADAEVSIDGAPVDRKALDDTPVPLDVGEHAVVVDAKGMQRETASVSVAQEATTTTFRLPRPTALPPAPAARAPEPAVRSEPPPAPRPAETTKLGPFQYAGIGAGVAGLGGVTVGTIFGLRASSLKSDSGCAETCTPDGDRILSDARDAATVSTIGFVAGAALLATGAALFFFAPRPKTTSIFDYASGRVVF